MQKRVLRALLVALWFMVLCFPLMGIKINYALKTIHWRYEYVFGIGVATFLLALLWHWSFDRKARGVPLVKWPSVITRPLTQLFQEKKTQYTSLAGLLVVLVFMPWLSSIYQTNIMISAMLYIILALGLNIIVGLTGQLVLGYAAFYAVGAYTYGILYQFFGIGFWLALPLGGCAAILAGLLLGLPVLGLRGDYLAIVTLGFGEIVRLVLQNFADITGGPRGISNIPRPDLFGLEMELTGTTIYMYYLVLIAVIVTILVISRLKHSRVGLALQALREDEIACEAMGVNTTKLKLSAFMLCSCWAGFAGVLFAAKTTYINPASFTFMDSAMILSMVVLGGMGSITGVVIAAAVLILVPEYLRAFSEYRMLIFGAIMVLMMIFRPQGLVTGEKRRYRISALHPEQPSLKEGAE